MRAALEEAGLDRAIEVGCWQPHEVPPGRLPPSSHAGAGLHPDEIVPGTVALRMDPLLLLNDDRVGAPQGRDRMGIGPFMCLEVSGDGSKTSWAALTHNARPGLTGHRADMARRRQHLVAAEEALSPGHQEALGGTKGGFVAAAWREAFSDRERARLTSDGLNAVQARVTGNSRSRPPESIPVDWTALARASTHPVQVSILEILGMDGGRILSPNELQIPVSNASYHVTRMAEAGLLVLIHTRQAPGATEHFYRRSDIALGPGQI